MSSAAFAVVAELACVFVVATALGWLCRRLVGIPVLGELVGGALLGPTLVGDRDPAVVRWFSGAHAGPTSVFALVGTLAATLLVGVTALELNLRAVRRDRHAVVRIAVAALAVPGLLGIVAALALPAAVRGHPSHEAGFVVFVGVALGVSALPVAAITLKQLGLFRRRIGRLILSAAAIDDVVGWLLLAVLTAVVARAGATALPVTLLGVVVLILVPVIGRRPTTALLARVVERPPGWSILVALVAIAVPALIAKYSGVELPIGAMAGGVLLSLCPDLPAPARRLLARVATGICGPLFLGIAGMHLDARVFREPVVLVSGVVLLLLAGAGKVVGGYVGARSAGVNRRTALATGAGLNARGMVEILIASIGLKAGLLTEAMYSILVGIAVLTSVITPILLRLILPDEVVVQTTDVEPEPRADAGSVTHAG
ncbi:transporter, CPA2 family [Jatrophihabitans endophyticus]|uniref:Transporter, CPA2 family n=1 Tax=Jatrophihabitans endophyticus TaxID=1206085 RepID=A0A1M5I6T4_9ACTN|nr:cation:proton antiporter [Jatrophihabitans endophyticus]SHG23922.1 transporter, CPA2 family [Jatrophihabitans endophyticus]